MLVVVTAPFNFVRHVRVSTTYSGDDASQSCSKRVTATSSRSKKRSVARCLPEDKEDHYDCDDAQSFTGEKGEEDNIMPSIWVFHS